MKKAIALIILVVIVGGTAALAVFRYIEKSRKEADGGDKNKESVVTVNMVMPERSTMLDERRFSGTAQAWSKFDIDPKVSGKLIQLNFDVGDAIRKGELIAKIDDEEYEQQVRQSEADLDVAKAKCLESKELVKLRTSEFNRQKTLRDANASSLSLYETAESALKTQEASSLMYAAEVKRCQAVLDNAKLKLSDTSIIAEWRTGSDIRYVGARYVDEGTLLSTGKQIIQLLEIDRVKAQIPVIERDYRFIKDGQTAEITTDAYPEETFAGTITNVSNMLSENTRNAIAVISIPNTSLKLRPGMFLRVRVVFDVQKDAQSVPNNAIVFKDGKKAVFCYDRESSRAVLTPVKTGLVTKERTQIVSPVLSMPVVTTGNHLLEDGRKIQISELSRSQLVEKLYGTPDGKPAKPE